MMLEVAVLLKVAPGESDTQTAECDCDLSPHHLSSACETHQGNRVECDLIYRTEYEMYQENRMKCV